MVLLFGGIIFTYATLTARVDAVVIDHQGIDTRLEKIENLTERIVKLEEGRQANTNDIQEIKADIKDIKKHFEIK